MSAATPAPSYPRNTFSRTGFRLRWLVGCATVNPPGEHYDVITRWLTRELTSLGLQAKRYDIPDAWMKKYLPPDQQAAFKKQP